MRATCLKISVLALLISAAGSLQAQYSVGATGTPIDSFTTIPPAANWSTRSLLGAATSYGIAATVGNLDAAINGSTNAASTITAGLTANGTSPLATLATAQHSTAGGFIGTRPTGNAATMMMATLVNNAGSTVTGFNIVYTLSDAGLQTTTGGTGSTAASAGTPEYTQAHRVYYNLGGAAGNWTLIGTLGANYLANQPINVAVSGISWALGSTNYLLFVDVNNQTNNDAINQIDDFSIASVVGGVITCPGITSQPQNVTFTQCISNSATFSVTATGTVSGLQWYRNNGGGFNPIVGATSPTYTLSPAGPSDSGAQFRAIVSGPSCSDAISSTATFTVIPDNTPPSVLRVVRYLSATNSSLTNLTIVFSEPIDTNTVASGDFTSGLLLVDTNTATEVQINGGAGATKALNNRTIVIEIDPSAGPLDPTHGYTLDIQFITDACAGNEMGETNVPVYSFVSDVLPLTANWKYLEDVTTAGANWLISGFDDSAWASGSGPLDMKRAGNYPESVTPGLTNNCRSNTLYMMQGPVPTCLHMTNSVTGATNMIVFFRTHFTYTGDTNHTFLKLSGKFDDGAAIYLNGTELTRIGIDPAAAGNPVTNGTASFRGTVGGSVGDADGRDVAEFLSTSLLHNGDNVIAVVLIQNIVTSSDLTMGLELTSYTLKALPAPVVGPTLHISHNGNSVTITWSGGGTLQGSTDLSNPANWVNVGGSPTSPFTTTATGYKFYQVKVP